MGFLYKQISDHRWGIYTDTRLLATVSDRATCEAIMTGFEGDRRDLMANRLGLKASLKQTVSNPANFNIPDSKILAKDVEPVEAFVVEEHTTQFAVASEDPAVSEAGTQLAKMMSDDDLARVLNLQSLKVKDLELAVLKAQGLQDRRRS